MKKIRKILIHLLVFIGKYIELVLHFCQKNTKIGHWIQGFLLGKKNFIFLLLFKLFAQCRIERLSKIKLTFDYGGAVDSGQE